MKRRFPCVHLVKEHTERPPVDVLVVAFVLDNFRRYVLRSATNSIREILTSLGALGKAEVG